MKSNEEQCRIFSNNLKYYMKRKGITQKELADALGFSQPIVHNWMCGERYPRINRIETLAAFFGISKSDLIEDKQNKPAYRLDSVKIPIVGDVCAGNGILAEENIIEYTGINESLSKRGFFFALNIKGDSMSPKIPDASTVIVRQQPDIESGQIAICFIEENNEGVCKVVYKRNNDIILQSLNPDYPPLIFTGGQGVQIIGKVFECRIAINEEMQ